MLGGTPIGRDRKYHFKSGVYDIPCFRCGICCSKYQPRLSLDEAHFIADRLAATWENFLAQYTDTRWPGTSSFLLRHKYGACVFLQTNSDSKSSHGCLCLIQAVKPACCREWKSGLDQAECREGLKTFWDLTVDSSGQINGSPEKLAAFESHLENLIP